MKRLEVTYTTRFTILTEADSQSDAEFDARNVLKDSIMDDEELSPLVDEVFTFKEIE